MSVRVSNYKLSGQMASASTSSINVKFGDIIRQYDGQGDFSEWLRKLELVADLQGVTTVEKFLPLFLCGGAFSVFESFDEDVRKDYAKLKTALTNAFSLNPCTAYEAFVSRRYVTGESVDVYLSELRRLGRLVSSTTTDSWIKCAFIAGLPENVKSQLKAACSLETMSLALVVERARSLTNAQETCGAVGLGKEKRPIICFNCRQPGHLSSNCTEKRHQGRTQQTL